MSRGKACLGVPQPWMSQRGACPEPRARPGCSGKGKWTEGRAAPATVTSQLGDLCPAHRCQLRWCDWEGCGSLRVLPASCPAVSRWGQGASAQGPGGLVLLFNPGCPFRPSRQLGLTLIHCGGDQQGEWWGPKSCLLWCRQGATESPAEVQTPHNTVPRGKGPSNPAASSRTGTHFPTCCVVHPFPCSWGSGPGRASVRVAGAGVATGS